MKKTYSKPEIVFESFTMSTNVAANCEVVDPHDPRLYFTGVGYAFTKGCEVSVSEGGDGEFNGICYHIPDGGKLNLFAS